MSIVCSGTGSLCVETATLAVSYSLAENGPGSDRPNQVERLVVLGNNQYQDKMTLFATLGSPIVLSLENGADVQIILYRLERNAVFSGSVLPGQALF